MLTATVEVRGIPEGDAEVGGASEGGEHLFLVGDAVEVKARLAGLGHAGACETY